jgi:hypothetical protein
MNFDTSFEYTNRLKCKIGKYTVDYPDSKLIELLYKVEEYNYSLEWTYLLYLIFFSRCLSWSIKC